MLRQIQLYAQKAKQSQQLYVAALSRRISTFVFSIKAKATTTVYSCGFFFISKAFRCVALSNMQIEY